MNSNSTDQSVTSINKAPMQDQAADKTIIEQDEVKPIDLDALKKLLKTNKEIEAQKLLELFITEDNQDYLDILLTFGKENNMSKLAIIKDFFQFLAERKAWWITPIVLFLFLFGFLIFMTQGSVIAPFIYALF